MISNKYVAVDFGATSGKIISGYLSGGQLVLEEEHRFSNDPVKVCGTVYWNILSLYHNVLIGLKKSAIDSERINVGIDSWGNDFALFDAKGNMLENPIHYRDELAKGMQQEVYSIIPAYEFYQTTGIQDLRINGLFRFYGMYAKKHSAYQYAKKFLMIPDIITYFLTGEMVNEYTNASNTQMLDAHSKKWAYGLLEKLGLDTSVFLEPIMPGTASIDLLPGVIDSQAKLHVVATHDTASAVACIPDQRRDFIYISSGTWSLVGTETNEPVINKKTFQYNFTNEGGVFDTNRLLKNVMGMWIVEELRREWQKNGVAVDYQAIISEAKKAKPFEFLIDPDDAAFLDIGYMSEKINKYLDQTCQKNPDSIGAYTRCVLDSLALKYKFVIDQIVEVTNVEYKTIYIVGGGAKNGLLNQITADICNMNVLAGPYEFTAAGNILTQMYSNDELSGLQDIREIISKSFQFQRYVPQHSEEAALVYKRFLDIEWRGNDLNRMSSN